MNRIIKFRVWDKSLKSMHVVGTNSHDELTCFDGEVQYYNLQNGEGSGEHGDYILMQYTGLKDRNGKEIYGGDVVRAWGGEYAFGYYEFDKKVIIKDFIIDTFLLTEFENLEVIGNIYEKPELLKQ